MNRALLVGDVHATPEELEDCEALMNYVIVTARAQSVKVIVLMGDLFHTHAVVRVEVLAFWRGIFKRMERAGLSVYALVGNHDYAGEGLEIHALMAHADQVTVVDGPFDLFPKVLMLPYISGCDEFIRVCGNYPSAVSLLCHQTFDGAMYDNGMYAPDGLDPNLIPQEFVISGHIHASQSFGKVTYVGAPRWRTLGDANIERAICLYDFGDDGAVLGCTKFDTGTVCRKIRRADHTPEAPINLEDLKDGSDWRVDIHGPSDWIEKEKRKLSGPGVRLRAFKTDRAAPKVRESEGVDTAFKKYLAGYTPRWGTSRERITELAQERLK